MHTSWCVRRTRTPAGLRGLLASRPLARETQVVADVPPEHFEELKKIYKTNALQNKDLYDATFASAQSGR